MLKTSAYLCIVMMFCGQLLHAEPTHSDKFLKKFDKNSDNRISFSEAPNKVQENFHRHDLDRDGYIKGDELRSIPKKHPSGHRPPPPSHRSGHRPHPYGRPPR